MRGISRGRGEHCDCERGEDWEENNRRERGHYREDQARKCVWMAEKEKEIRRENLYLCNFQRDRGGQKMIEMRRGKQVSWERF